MCFSQLARIYDFTTKNLITAVRYSGNIAILLTEIVTNIIKRFMYVWFESNQYYYKTSQI